MRWPMSLNLTVASLCLVTSVLWGLWGLFGKMALERGMPPYVVFLCTALVNAVVAAGFIPFGPGLGAVKNGPWSIFAGLAGAVMAVGSIAFYYVLRRDSASVVIVATSTYPLFTLILSAVFLRERLTTVQLAGAGLVIVGMVLVLTTGSR